MRIRSGLSVLWRRPGESQIGIEATSAIVLSGLSAAEQQWLDLLERDRTEDQLLAAARDLGIEGSRAAELLGELEARGLIARQLPDPLLDRHGLSAEEDFWQRFSGRASSVIARRRARVVAVMGLGRIGAMLACGLAASGVGTILVADRRQVGRGDVGVGAYAPHDVGRPREDRVRALLRSQHEQVAISAPPRTRPDLVVMCIQDVAEPQRIRPLMREDVPHLVISQHELSALVGPLVVPGMTPCVQCIEMRRAEADSCWPAIATQLLGARERRLPAAVAVTAAGFGLTEVLAFLDHREVTTAGRSLVVTGTSGGPRGVEWQFHPRCGCRGPDAPPQEAVAGASQEPAGGTSTSSPRTTASTAAP
ncbi:MAG TPA: hypothetical protein VK024_06960 [Actinomycetaceae bacterium]|nr:hypothetical protein [Actinomycetaceae bacterium]